MSTELRSSALVVLAPLTAAACATIRTTTPPSGAHSSTQSKFLPYVSYTAQSETTAITSVTTPPAMALPTTPRGSSRCFFVAFPGRCSRGGRALPGLGRPLQC